MSTKIKNQLKEVMLMAWTFVKRKYVFFISD